MSGVVKTVGKVFKKVVKVVKKVLPIALAGAAIFFTAGSALGLTPSFGAFTSGLVGKLGLSSTLSGILTGAVTQAGIGAALGGGLSLVTGGDFLEGAQGGALAGAVTGGVLGGFGLPTDPFPSQGPEGGFFSSTTGPSSTVAPTSTTAPSNATNAISGAPSVATGPPVNLTQPQIQGISPELLGGAAKTAADTSTGLLSKLTSDRVIAGAVEGVGKGIFSFAGSQVEAEATEQAARLAAESDEAARQRIAGNFASTGRGLLTSGGVNSSVVRPTPAVRFNPQNTFRGGRFEFNPQSGRVEFVANAA